MSARNIALEQPESFSFSKDSEKEIKFWLNKYPEPKKASAVIPMLWIAQKQEGWVSEPAMREIADRLDMPKIRVMEVATFYTMFNLEPAGEHLIQVCGTTPCWLRGAEDLKKVCEDKIGPKGHVSADGKFSWMEVECLGACANAPMVQISNAETDHYYEDLTADSMAAILDDLAAGKAPKPGSQSGRSCSEAEGGSPTLTDASLYDGSLAKPVKLPNAANDSGEKPNKPTEKARPKDTGRTGAKADKKKGGA
jgi:NADH-quinone oxidoreductase subunit E